MAGAGGLVTGLAALPHGGTSALLATVVGTACLMFAVAAWFVPWDRWPNSRMLVVVPLVFLLLALGNLANPDPYLASGFFPAFAVWLGLSQRRGTTLALAPMFALAYWLPLEVQPHGSSLAASVPTVVAGSVLVGETLAWTSARLRASNARLRLATAERYRTVLGMARSLSGASEFGDVAGQVVRWTGELTNSTSASIALLNEEGDTPTTLAAYHADQDGPTPEWGDVPRIRSDAEAVRRALETQQPVGFEARESIAGPDVTTPGRSRSALVLPLLSSGRTIGLMEVARRGPDAYSASEIEFCQAMGNIAAAAVHNAKLLADVTATSTQYRALVEQLPAATYHERWDGAESYVSPQIEQIFGCTPQEWNADDDAWLTYVHPEDRAATAREWAEFAAGDAAGMRCEYRAGNAEDVRWVLDMCARLPNEPDQLIGLIFDITEQKKAQQQLATLAYEDTLTGLANRAKFEEDLEHSVRRAREHNRAVAVLCVDLDDFKLVNDTHGHATGDDLVRMVAARLRAIVRDAEVLARMGGDEFLVLLTDLALDGADAAVVAAADRIRTVIDTPFRLQDSDLHLAASVGASVFPLDAQDAGTLLKHADTALYQAKAAGRNTVRMYSAPSMTIADQLSIGSRLRQAFDRRQLRLVYQPIVDLRSGRTVGAEALLRWDTPEGAVPPAVFIPVAERTGLIRPITSWIVSQAIEQARLWRLQGTPVYVSINLPPMLAAADELDGMLDAIAHSGLPVGSIMVELTETGIMQAVGGPGQLLKGLQARGVQLAIDDFGTGHSSLGRLKDMPATTVKIDRSFISGLPDDPTSVALARAILDMARALDIRVIAEGIETSEQLQFLRSHGCPTGQGLLLGRPVPAEQLVLDQTQRAA
ncbi:MAG: putative bifunctional diguanylate cyclase/phosphodiesterase, partial [Gaiellales bacterium]